MSMKRIAARLGVSVATVHAWTSDIELTDEQRRRNLFGPLGPQNPERVAKRIETWKRKHKEKRLRHQTEGRERARGRDPLHMAGCMLYWAEGAKGKNTLTFANSDLNMVKFFCRFLRECFELAPGDFRMRLNVYLGNGMSITQIENHWLGELKLPRSSLRAHSINHFPTSSSGRKRNKLPYGVCTVSVARSTWLVQHIFGAIQEYAGFDEPRWLDGPPRKPAGRAS